MDAPLQLPDCVCTTALDNICLQFFKWPLFMHYYKWPILYSLLQLTTFVYSIVMVLCVLVQLTNFVWNTATDNFFYNTAFDNIFMHYCKWKFFDALFHELLQLTFFVCPTAIGNFCISTCNWPLLYARLHLIVFGHFYT